MDKRVLKRDGRLVKFNPEKITIAVMKAMKAIDQIDDEFAEEVTTKIVEFFANNNEIEVEDIQDKVEDALIISGKTKLAKTYILYREKLLKINKSPPPPSFDKISIFF